MVLVNKRWNCRKCYSRSSISLNGESNYQCVLTNGMKNETQTETHTSNAVYLYYFTQLQETHEKENICSLKVLSLKIGRKQHCIFFISCSNVSLFFKKFFGLFSSQKLTFFKVSVSHTVHWDSQMQCRMQVCISPSDSNATELRCAAGESLWSLCSSACIRNGNYKHHSGKLLQNEHLSLFKTQLPALPFPQGGSSSRAGIFVLFPNRP